MFELGWSKVQKEHVDAAIQKFIDEKPEHTLLIWEWMNYNNRRIDGDIRNE